MKKTKKYIAVLSSVIIMASCAVSNVFAVGTDNNSDDVTVSPGTSEKITDPNEIVKLLKDYAEKENRFIINGVSLASDDEGYDVIVNIYFNKHEKHETIIRDYMKENNIESLRTALAQADAVVIGAGAGLSTSAGFTYSGEWFHTWFSDFEKKYHFGDMYSGGFYPYDTLEEYWAYWSRYIYVNRYRNAPKPV